MTDSVVRLDVHRPAAPGIVEGLRGLADEIEAKGDTAPVTTCVVLLGHSWMTGDQPNVSFGRYVFGPRNDPLTVAGLQTMGLANSTG